MSKSPKRIEILGPRAQAASDSEAATGLGKGVKGGWIAMASHPITVGSKSVLFENSVFAAEGGLTD